MKFRPLLETLENRWVPSTYYWSPQTTDDFSAGNNWVDGANQRYAFTNSPNSDDYVVFNNANKLNVLFTDNVTVKQWIEQITINMNIDLNGKTLTLLDDGSTFKGSTWNTNGGGITVDGTATLTTNPGWGGLTGGGTVTVNGGARIYFDTDSNFDFKTNLVVNGTVDFRRGVTIDFDTYDFDVNNAGMVNLMPMSGTLRIKTAATNANTLTNAGLFYKQFETSAIIQYPVVQNTANSQFWINQGTVYFDPPGTNQLGFHQSAGQMNVKVGGGIDFEDEGFFQTGGLFQLLHRYNATTEKQEGGTIASIGLMNFVGGEFKFGGNTNGDGHITFSVVGSILLEGTTVYMSTYYDANPPPPPPPPFGGMGGGGLSISVPENDQFFVTGYFDIGGWNVLRIKDNDDLLPIPGAYPIITTVQSNQIFGDFAGKYTGWTGTTALVYSTQNGGDSYDIYRPSA